MAYHSSLRPATSLNFDDINNRVTHIPHLATPPCPSSELTKFAALLPQHENRHYTASISQLQYPTLVVNGKGRGRLRETEMHFYGNHVVPIDGGPNGGGYISALQGPVKCGKGRGRALKMKIETSTDTTTTAAAATTTNHVESEATFLCESFVRIGKRCPLVGLKHGRESLDEARQQLGKHYTTNLDHVVGRATDIARRRTSMRPEVPRSVHGAVFIRCG